MTTIRDRAVRALHPLFGEAGNFGGPLAYCCDGPCGQADCKRCPAPCPHSACTIALALYAADCLGYASDTVDVDPHQVALSYSDSGDVDRLAAAMRAEATPGADTRFAEALAVAVLQRVAGVRT